MSKEPPIKPCNYPPGYQDCDGCPEGLRCQGWDNCQQAYVGYIRLPGVEEIRKRYIELERTCKLCKWYKVNVCCGRPDRFGECLEIDGINLAQELHDWLEEQI